MLDFLMNTAKQVLGRDLTPQGKALAQKIAPALQQKWQQLQQAAQKPEQGPKQQKMTPEQINNADESTLDKFIGSFFPKASAMEAPDPKYQDAFDALSAVDKSLGIDNSSSNQNDYDMSMGATGIDALKNVDLGIAAKENLPSLRSFQSQASSGNSGVNMPSNGPQEQGSLLSRGLDQLGGAFEDNIGAKETIKRGIGGAVNTVGGGIKGLWNLAEEGVSAITPDVIEGPIKNFAGKAAKAIIEHQIPNSKVREMGQKGAEEIQKWYETLPQEKKDYIDSAFQIATVVPWAGVIGKVGSKAKAVGKFGLSQTTGLAPETISTIRKIPELFSSAQKGAITRETLAGKAVSAIEGNIKKSNIISGSVANSISALPDNAKSLVNKILKGIDRRAKEISETGTRYGDIRSFSQVIEFPKKQIDDVLKSRGIKITKNGLNFDNTNIGDISDIRAVQNAYDFLKGKKSFTGADLLNIRGKIDDMVNRNSLATSKGQGIVKEMRGIVDDAAKSEIPGLKELDSKYGSEKSLLNKVSQDFLNPDKTLKDGALQKLSRLTEKGKEAVLNRLEKAVPGITKEINKLKDLDFMQRNFLNPDGTFKEAALELPEHSLKQAERIVPGIRKSLDDFIDLTRIKRDFLNPDGTLKDNAMGKLANLTSKGKEQILGRLEKVQPGMGKEINALKALEDVQLSSGIKVGNYSSAVRTGSIAGGVLTGNPAWIAFGVISHPAISVPILKGYALLANISKKVLKDMIAKIDRGQKLTGLYKDIMQKALTTEAKALSIGGQLKQSED